MKTARGRVTLVGAGPGDPDLLTIAAVKALVAADVILVDDLVHPSILAHASRSARIVQVGKRGPLCRAGRALNSDAAERPSTPQAFIERLMIAEARKGLHVVRLKGGDPYVFGRGGEERAHLMRHGIETRVVPGISSGIAGPAALGIPVTHRDLSQGVIFVTGHRKRRSVSDAALGKDAHNEADNDARNDARNEADADAAPDVDWGALAATGLTLVVYMGVGRCRAIVDALIASGKPAGTPAAAVQSACTAGQRQVVGTLGDLAEAIERTGIESPAILVIGDVVRCADAHWTALGAHPAMRR